MRYYVLAGEASGDLHASNLIKEISLIDQQAQFRGFGGELMEKAGMAVLKHYRDLAFMGLVPVILNIRTIRKNFRYCEQDMLDFKPDVLILVDYPGFNLRMAQFAKAHGLRTFYYISPKIWAWKEKRVYKVIAYVDEMFTILPFETGFYKKYDYPVNYVGNPLLDAILEKKIAPDFPKFWAENELPEKPILAVLPGSRKGEISVLLPTMLEAAAQFPEFQCIIAGAPNMGIEYYRPFMKENQAPIIWGKTYEIMIHSRIAIVSSGTAALETAILNVPQVVVYQMTPNWLFKYLKFFLITKWVSLVNIILGREAVTELIQSDFTLKNVVHELKKILHDPENEKRMLADYREMMIKLGEPGASKKAAGLMVSKLQAYNSNKN
ncbi:MAG: lipid-A-disaccharide synthase [Bacteroidota bacterium]|nr:lipid-A-disaccharide synthase [Odoribacter sp.]MDP3642847.1 lipid-A-disaccharide synthase [Bacteroidota bacterium]